MNNNERSSGNGFRLLMQTGALQQPRRLKWLLYNRTLKIYRAIFWYKEDGMSQWRQQFFFDKARDMSHDIDSANFSIHNIIAEHHQRTTPFDTSHKNKATRGERHKKNCYGKIFAEIAASPLDDCCCKRGPIVLKVILFHLFVTDPVFIVVFLDKLDDDDWMCASNMSCFKGSSLVGPFFTRDLKDILRRPRVYSSGSRAAQFVVELLEVIVVEAQRYKSTRPHLESGNWEAHWTSRGSIVLGKSSSSSQQKIG